LYLLTKDFYHSGYLWCRNSMSDWKYFRIFSFKECIFLLVQRYCS